MSAVLVVEDEPVVQEALSRALTDLGHTVIAVGTALEALREVTASKPALVILDLMLPDLDGATMLQMLRSVSNVPVIVATANGDENTIVKLYDAGADDYIVKPFSNDHFAARVRAVLRRLERPEDDRAGGDAEGGENARHHVLSVGELRLDRDQRTASLGDSPLVLTRLQFDLVAYLAERAGRVVPRGELYEAVWQQTYFVGSQSIDVQISWIRRKLGETASEPRYLHTVRGIGFRLSAPT
jgi:DNA-binding response OmpR family regulator